MKLLLVLLLSAGTLSLPATAQQGSPDQLQTIAISAGDTLWFVAQKYLKDRTKWEDILRYNTVPSTDPAATLPDMTLNLPTRILREEFQAAQLISTVNSVFYRSHGGGPWAAAAADMEVFRDDTIKTMAASEAFIRFIDDEPLQINPDSIAVVMPDAKDYHIELERGGMMAGNKRIRVGAAVVSPSDPSTVYEASVRDGQSIVVRVFKGEASVAAAGKAVQVGMGQATEVKADSAPSRPFTIPDLSSFQSLVSRFEAKLRSFKEDLAKAPPPPPPAAPRPQEVPPADELVDEVASIRGLEAVSGYRIECSTTQDLKALVVHRFFDASAPMRPEDFDLPLGRYWCRMAPVDLLGAVGKFGKPKLYSLGRPVEPP
jgi:hypothetical protein